MKNDQIKSSTYKKIIVYANTIINWLLWIKVIDWLVVYTYVCLVSFRCREAYVFLVFFWQRFLFSEAIVLFKFQNDPKTYTLLYTSGTVYAT